MQDNAPFVSVIIPTYNLAEYTAEALDSAKAQTFRDFEVVIVDDGSSDNTVEVIRPYLSDPRFTLIQQANQGTAAARNTAIEHARGEWIALLDCDDLWMPDKLEKQVKLIEADPGTALVFSNGIEFNERGDDRPFYRKREVFPDGVGLARVLQCNCFWACSVMVRRSHVLAAGMMRSDLPGVDDYDMWLKVLERGGTARGVWDPVARYRKRSDNQCLNKRAMLERLLRVYEDTRQRLTDPRLNAIASDCVNRVRCDLQMVAAREALGEQGWRECRRLMLAAWRRRPGRTKPLRLAVASLLGFKGSVAKTLARKW